MINNFTESFSIDKTREWVAEGVTGGIIAFLMHNRVNINPTRESKSPVTDFADLLLDEYLDGKRYPFKDSLKKAVEDELDVQREVVLQLFERQDTRNLKAFCHVVGGEVVAKFLEDHREETLKLILKIRGE